MPDPTFVLALSITIVLLFAFLWRRSIFSYVIPIIHQLIGATRTFASRLAKVVLVCSLAAAFVVAIVLFWIKEENQPTSPWQELFLVQTTSNVRPNPDTQNDRLGVLEPGDTIHSLSVVTGESVNGNNHWIRFLYKGSEAYVWSGLVATRMPEPAGTGRPLATETPYSTRRATATVQPTARPTDAKFLSPRRCGYVYDQPRFPAVLVGRVVPIDVFPIVAYVSGGEVNGSTEWLQLKYNHRDAYIPQSYVELESRPYSAAPTAPSFDCNCSKSCDEMKSCAEAFYQLLDCDCGSRDRDNDGIPCDDRCECLRY